jgi:hypothetical protein
MTQERKDMNKVDRLVEALIEETLTMSDEEILADANESAGELERACRTEVGLVIASHLRQRLLAAKDAVSAHKLVGKSKHRSAGDLRAAINKAVAKHANDDAAFTLAARDGRDVPDADLEGLAEDLKELGIDLDGEEEPDPS